MMRFAIPTIAFAAATFTATLMFAPVIGGVVGQISFEQAPVVQASAPAAKEERVCPPVAKIVAALRLEECL